MRTRQEEAGRKETSLLRLGQEQAGKKWGRKEEWSRTKGGYGRKARKKERRSARPWQEQVGRHKTRKTKQKSVKPRKDLAGRSEEIIQCWPR